jgi:hypothetical protein
MKLLAFSISTTMVEMGRTNALRETMRIPQGLGCQRRAARDRRASDASRKTVKFLYRFGFSRAAENPSETDAFFCFGLRYFPMKWRNSPARRPVSSCAGGSGGMAGSAAHPHKRA